MTPKKQLLMDDMSGLLGDAERFAYMQIADFLIELGYLPERRKVKDFSLAFKHPASKKIMARFDMRQVGKQTPFPLISIKFFGAGEVSQRYADVLVRNLSEESNHAGTPRASTEKNRCDRCGAICTGGGLGYYHQYPDGGEALRCGAYPVPIYDLTADDVDEMKQVILRQHEYFLSIQQEKRVQKSILLIGPMGVGKTCVAKALSEALSLPYVDSDALRWAYFAKQPDYDEQTVEALFEASKGEDAFRYMKPFEARFTVHLLESGDARVVDFGAGYTVYEDEALFESVRAAFAKYRHVLLLRYSADGAESLAALRERHPDVPPALYEALNRAFIESPCNARLATQTIDTKGRTVDQVVALALEMVEKAIS